MFEALADAVEELEVPSHGDAIVEARRLRDALEARIAEAEAAYHRDHGWDRDGYGSMAAFLRHRCAVASGEATRAARRAERLVRWPELLDAWQAGTVTAAQVDACATLVPHRHIERVAAVAGQVVTELASRDLTATRQLLRDWMRFADDLAQREAAEAGATEPVVAPGSELYLSPVGDETVLDATLDDSDGAVVRDAISAATRPDLEGERRSPAQRRADALVEISRHYLAHHDRGATHGRPDRLTVTCDVVALYRSALRGAGVRTAAQLGAFLASLPGLGALERGLFLDAFDGRAGTARTATGNPVGDGLLACISEHGILERLLTVDSVPVDLGRGVRVATDAQRRALTARDGPTCAAPGCDATRDLHAHHHRPWQLGGPTDLANLVALCPHDHHRLHRGGQPAHAGGTSPPAPAPPAHAPPVLPTTARPAPELPFDPAPVERGPDPDHDPAEIARIEALARERCRQLARRGHAADTAPWSPAGGRGPRTGGDGRARRYPQGAASRGGDDHGADRFRR